MEIFELLNPEKKYLRNAKALIFDFDGTLVDSMRYWRPEKDDIKGFPSVEQYVKSKYDTVVEPKPDAVALMTLLHENGIRFCIATDTPRSLSEGFFKRWNFDSLADFYISSDDVNAYKLYSPAIYLEAARRMGKEINECVVFEDYMTSARTAKEAGFPTVGVYDSYSKNDLPVMKAFCDGYIYNLGELLRK